MATVSLGATPRTETGKGVVRKLRAQGQVPGIVYGHGREPQALTVNQREFERLAERVRITSTVIELALDGKTARTLIRELQRDPIRRTVIHIDFQELVAGEKVVVSVPLRFIGTADGVKNSGGILEEVIHQLHVRCDPSNIPDHIDVDVTPLTIGHGLHVSDLKLPEGVEVTDDPETTVATVSAPVVEEEVAPVAAEGVLAAPEAAAEPELIRKPKAEEEGEESES
jgi:large subunit ribosomal protein L25